jgi:hypothetical protein
MRNLPNTLCFHLAYVEDYTPASISAPKYSTPLILDGIRFRDSRWVLQSNVFIKTISCAVRNSSGASYKNLISLSSGEATTLATFLTVIKRVLQSACSKGSHYH